MFTSGFGFIVKYQSLKTPRMRTLETLYCSWHNGHIGRQFPKKPLAEQVGQDHRSSHTMSMLKYQMYMRWVKISPSKGCFSSAATEEPKSLAPWKSFNCHAWWHQFGYGAWSISYKPFHFNIPPASYVKANTTSSSRRSEGTSKSTLGSTDHRRSQLGQQQKSGGFE